VISFVHCSAIENEKFRRSGRRHFYVNPCLVATCTTSGFYVDESRARSGA